MKRLTQIAGIILCLTILYGVVKAQTPSGAYTSPAQGGSTTYTGTSPIVVAGTAISCPTCGTGTGNALTSNPLSQFASTTSAQLAGVLSDETGTGAAVFANTPTLVTPNIGAATGSSVNVTGTLTSGSNGGTSGVLALNGSTSGTQTCTTNATSGSATCTGTWTAATTGATSAYSLNGKTFASVTAPTISSGFGTSPSIVSSNGTTSFRVNVGIGGVATSGVIGLPNATNNWNCQAYNLTAQAGNRADGTVVTTASATNSITVQNQTLSTGAALAWTASDVLVLNCGAN